MKANVKFFIETEPELIPPTEEEIREGNDEPKPAGKVEKTTIETSAEDPHGPHALNAALSEAQRQLFNRENPRDSIVKITANVE